jgi:hypothetical protein
MEITTEKSQYYINVNSVRMVTKTIYNSKTGYTIVLTGGELEEKDNQILYDAIYPQLKNFYKINLIDNNIKTEIMVNLRYISGILFKNSDITEFNGMVVLYLENVIQPSYFYFYNRDNAIGFYYQLKTILQYQQNELLQLKNLNINDNEIIKLKI